MLGSLVLWVGLVHPLATWLLRRSATDRRALWCAIGLIFFVSSAQTVHHAGGRGVGHYAMLSVKRGESAERIKVAFKEASLSVHPDHNPSQTAASDFVALTNAFEVLSNDEQRDAYDRLGDDAAKAGEEPDPMKIGIDVFAFYALWGVVAFALTSEDAVDVGARKASIAVLLVFAITEASVLVLDHSEAIPPWVLPYHSVRDICEVLRRHVALVVVVARCLGMLEHTEATAGGAHGLEQLLRAGHEQNARVLAEIAKLHAAILPPQQLQQQSGAVAPSS